MPSPDPQNPSPAEPPARPSSGWVRLARLCNNPISIFGLLVVALSVFLLITFALFTVIAAPANPYLDMIGFLILPSLLMGGLVVVPLGIWWRHWRLRRQARRAGRGVEYPRVDLNDRGTRASLAIFAGLTAFIVLPLVGITSYEGYHYTESTRFCAETCHSVMEPQATAHGDSPHARVSCAECHIGSGASWFVKSKLSGTRQVFAVLQDSYPRPIPPAITELRPARETCEECHWPDKFFGMQYREVPRFSPDEQNTRRVVRMLLKTGGADASIGRVEGIHAHMVLSSKVDYIAVDDALQQIPWVRYVRDSGEEVIYRSDGLPVDAPPPAGIMRTVDCMDCHNRGAHHFRGPQDALDLFLNVRRIDLGLPFVKREAAEALVQPYPDKTTAQAEISRRLSEFYQREYPEIWQQRQPAVQQAVVAVQSIYARNFFPEMKTDWRTFPENIGHMNSPGCFRCHDGKHVDAQGVAIRSDCESCHLFLNPLPPGATPGPGQTTLPAAALGGGAQGGGGPGGTAEAFDVQPAAFVIGPFVHSMDLIQHPNLRCEQCHTGGTLPRCRDCHATGEWLEERGRGMFEQTGP